MELTLKLPDKVRRDVAAYRGRVEKFLRGEMSPVAFRAYRVPMGIYEQRQSGAYMVRIRVGAGIASGLQLRRIAQLSRLYGSGIVHVTTRQDFQIHNVKIEQTPDVLEALLEADLSSRGGGGNTVRNVTACPRAGLCRQEQFNVAPHALAVAEYLLQLDSSYNLPRKYKIAFSGCSDDCALACVADLGFFAHRRNGMKGFAVYAGGGLGPNAAVAVKVEDFVEEHEIFEVAEAVKRLFDRYGDRSNRHRARLRYVLARFGHEEFVRLYCRERQRVRREGLEGRTPAIAETADESRKRDVQDHVAPDLLPQKGHGLYTFRLRLPLGDVPADDLVRIAELAETYGVGVVRTTQQQDLLIPSVCKAKLDALRKATRTLSIDVPVDRLPKVVACAGASTCKLGLCLSRGLAKAIRGALAGQASPTGAQPVIRISGCPNSCGQHLIGEIGFQGHAKRVKGRLMPCYDVLVGGRAVEGAARLAEPVGTLPAKRIPEFIAQVFGAGELTADSLRRLAREHSELALENASEDDYYDWDSDMPFSLAGRGPGECGAGVMDVIKVDIAEAARALKHARQSAVDEERDRSIYQALLASARALLVLSGSQPGTDREIFETFRRDLVKPGWVKPTTHQLLDDAIDWRMNGRRTLAGLLPDVADLAGRVEVLFLSLDANLRFGLDPIAAVKPTPEPLSTAHKVDLRGVPCPLNFVKAKLAVEEISIGETLEITLDPGEPIENVPSSLAGQGQEIVETTRVDDHFRLTVRRKQ